MASFDEISSYLDVENSVTVRWLANTLRIDLSNARQSLKKFKDANQSVIASYLVVGTTSNGGMSYIVAEESELGEIRSTLISVRSEEVYALHKNKSVTMKAELQALEYEQASELLLMGHPNTADFLSNSGGYITCLKTEIKGLGQRILSSNYTEAPVSASAKEVIKNNLLKNITEKATAPVVLKSKSSIQATSFFGAKAAPAKSVTASSPVSVPAVTTAAVKSEPAVISVAAAKTAVQVATPALEESVKTSEAPPQKRVGKISVDDDEDEEWDAGYKPDPARLKQRVETEATRTGVKVGSTEDVVLEDEVGDIADGADEELGGKRKGKGKVVLHGAMDDYMEDIAIAEHNRAEANPDAPKPKKRKLVEKVRIIAGYFSPTFYFFLYEC